MRYVLSFWLLWIGASTAGGALIGFAAERVGPLTVLMFGGLFAAPQCFVLRRTPINARLEIAATEGGALLGGLAAIVLVPLFLVVASSSKSEALMVPTIMATAGLVGAWSWGLHRTGRP
jgi:hypothetical protein